MDSIVDLHDSLIQVLDCRFNPIPELSTHRVKVDSTLDVIDDWFRSSRVVDCCKWRTDGTETQRTLLDMGAGVLSRSAPQGALSLRRFC